MRRHNLVLESEEKNGRGWYVAPYKKIPKSLPKHHFTKTELTRFAKKLKIPKLRGVFMSDPLPTKIRKRECGIINLDISSGEGSHGTAYAKNNEEIIYYDSYGNLKPP